MDSKELSHLSLGNISPLDGREALFTQKLRTILSEGALHRYRAVVEIENLISLADSSLPNKPTINESQRSTLREVVSQDSFDASAVNDYDHFGRNGIGPTEHDVKSVELYLRERLDEAGLSEFSEFIHFPMTSEDVNNLAYNLMIRDAINQVWLPQILETLDKLAIIVEDHADVPVLGKTHGMNASPTTVGKRFGYTLDKLTDSLGYLSKLRLKGKFSGPVGNHNAMHAVVPEFDVEAYVKEFVESFGFEYSPVENQRISHQNIVRVLQEIGIINTFGADLCENVRHNVMMGWLYQEGKASHVGSSVMPHKINPWFFEVGQGYFEIANRLIDGARDGLILSVFERDLTDHPWERLYGEMFGGSLVGFTYICQGLDTLRVNHQQALDDLKTTSEVLSEAVQIGGRLLGVNDIYMKIKQLTRGRNLDRDALREVIDSEIPDSEIKRRLLAANPAEYTGIAKKSAKRAVSEYTALRSSLESGILHDLTGLSAVLFDFDNTLQTGDKDELHARLDFISKKMGMGYSNEEIKRFGNRSDYREMRNLMVTEHNRRNPDALVTEDQFQELNNQISGRFDDRLRLSDGTKELLDYLKSQGFKIGLVTTRGSNSLSRLLSMHGISEAFDVVINRDDCKERKPHPQPILAALEKIGVAPERAIYVGDKQVDDIISGNSIGMRTVLVNSDELDPYCAKPDYHVATPSEVLSILKRK